ncbi:hypothetical protein SASPL_118837 [Salvia splendens]|uniref:Coatomer subunit zeta n=3 Tax=Salvia subgen. Calosphace TaxID=2026555 RepID=A0A8X8XXH7_SALSN|nr:hypothetical protein SASPL_118837 [Salvia splendens]
MRFFEDTCKLPQNLKVWQETCKLPQNLKPGYIQAIHFASAGSPFILSPSATRFIFSRTQYEKKMLLAVLIANSEGNILVERFNGVPAEERLHWRSFLVKLGVDNLRGVKNEELLVANHKSVYIVYTVLGDVSIFVVGKDEYDELALSEAIFVITSALKDVCGKPPTERLFLDKYGKICLCLDEIVWKGLLENTDKDRIKRLIRLKPPTDF